MDDLRKVTKDDLIAFHNKYYVPNNAIAIYVGDFKPETIVALAEKYFGAIPKGADVEPVRTGEPPQYSEKGCTARDRECPVFSSGSTFRLTAIRISQLLIFWPAFSLEKRDD